MLKIEKKIKKYYFYIFFIKKHFYKSILHYITKHTYKIEWNFILNLWEDACQPFIIIIIIRLIIRNIYKNNVKVHSCLPLLLLFDHKKLVERCDVSAKWIQN